MPTVLWRARCQWCGKIGNTSTRNQGTGAPSNTPVVPGSCPSHPSGEKNKPHAPRWEQA